MAQPPQAMRFRIEVGQAAGNLQVAPDRFARTVGVVQVNRVAAPAFSGLLAGQRPAQPLRCRPQR